MLQRKCALSHPGRSIGITRPEAAFGCVHGGAWLRCLTGHTIGLFPRQRTDAMPCRTLCSCTLQAVCTHHPLSLLFVLIAWLPTPACPWCCYVRHTLPPRAASPLLYCLKCACPLLSCRATLGMRPDGAWEKDGGRQPYYGHGARAKTAGSVQNDGKTGANDWVLATRRGYLATCMGPGKEEVPRPLFRLGFVQTSLLPRDQDRLRRAVAAAATVANATAPAAAARAAGGMPNGAVLLPSVLAGSAAALETLLSLSRVARGTVSGCCWSC